MIRWIRERLGTAAHNEIGDGAWLIIDVRHLVDKGGNSASMVRSLIEQGVAALREGKTVIVACDFGISRSNAIAAGILCLTESLPFDDALQDVVRVTGEQEIKLDLAESVRTAVGAQRREGVRGTVLVTGATGLIGRSLVARLERSCKVLGPPRCELDLDRGAVALADYCSREQVGQIVHLAYPREYTNVSAAGSSLMMLRSVLDTCRLLKIRLIFVSCWVVFSGYPTSALIADEATPLRPRGVYAETKAIEELLVDLHFQRGDIERSICRLAPVYGPGGLRPRLIQTFHQGVTAGLTIKTHCYRNGPPALDLLYISDAAEGIARVIDFPNNDIFHFGTGKLSYTSEVAASIARIAGRPFAQEVISIDDDTSNIAFDGSKAYRLMGWLSQVDIEEGLRSTLSREMR